jgi:hypothetical protein
VLQRNASGSPLTLPTLNPPAEVPSGGEIDYPEPLPGFEPVEPAAEPEEPKAAPKTTKTKAPVPPDAEEATK